MYTSGNWFAKKVGNYRGQWDEQPIILTTSLPAAQTTASYSLQMLGGPGTWSATGLPTEWSVSSSGVLSKTGTSAAGTASVVFTLTATSGRIATTTLSLVTAVQAVAAEVTTASITTATVGVSGSQVLTYIGDGTVTLAAIGLPIGASLSGATLSWTTGVAAGVYPVSVTPTSSVRGVGATKVFQWSVVAAAATDQGAWAPLLRKRLA